MEHHHVDICRQGDQVCTEFFDGLEASATDHADLLDLVVTYLKIYMAVFNRNISLGLMLKHKRSYSF